MNIWRVLSNDFIMCGALQSISISKHPRRKAGQDLILKQLKIDLEWQAKSLAFKLVTKKTDFWYIFNKVRTSLTGPELAEYFMTKSMFELTKNDPSFDDLNTRYQNLAKDDRFMKFSKNLGKEFEEAFSKLARSAQPQQKQLSPERPSQQV